MNCSQENEGQWILFVRLALNVIYKHIYFHKLQLDPDNIISLNSKELLRWGGMEQLVIAARGAAVDCCTWSSWWLLHVEQLVIAARGAAGDWCTWSSWCLVHVEQLVIGARGAAGDCCTWNSWWLLHVEQLVIAARGSWLCIAWRRDCTNLSPPHNQ